MSERGRRASDKLTVALMVQAVQGRRPNCSDAVHGEKWLSEFPAERRLAAAMCSGCCVWTECGEAAASNHEQFGVWASVDRTSRVNSRKDIAA